MSPRLRSIGAVVTGFVLIGALSTAVDMWVRATWPQAFDASGRTDDAKVLLGSLAYVGVIATFGCWLAGRLAPDRPFRHGMILGVAGFVFLTIMSIAMWNTAPAWYHVGAIVLSLVWGYLGGKLAERTRDEGREARMSS